MIAAEVVHADELHVTFKRKVYIPMSEREREREGKKIGC